MVGQTLGCRVVIASRRGRLRPEGNRSQHRGRQTSCSSSTCSSGSEVLDGPEGEEGDCGRTPRGRREGRHRHRPRLHRGAQAGVRRSSPCLLIEGEGPWSKRSRSITVDYLGQVYATGRGLRRVLRGASRPVRGRHRRPDPGLGQGPRRGQGRQPRVILAIPSEWATASRARRSSPERRPDLRRRHPGRESRDRQAGRGTSGPACRAQDRAADEPAHLPARRANYVPKVADPRRRRGLPRVRRRRVRADVRPRQGGAAHPRASRSRSARSSPGFEDELGYRIAARPFELPEITSRPTRPPSSGWRPGLAARRPRAGHLPGPAQAQAGGVDVDEAALTIVEPQLATDEPTFDAFCEGVTAADAGPFDYRRPGPEAATRHLEPWGIVSYHGHWYVVGHDLDRDAPRMFRLSRVEGECRSPAEGHSTSARHSTSAPWLVAGAGASAQHRLRAGPAGLRDVLRRHARARARPVDEGWDRLDLAFGSGSSAGRRAGVRPRRGGRGARRGARDRRRLASRRGSPMSRSARRRDRQRADQVDRMLALVPYLRGREGISVEEVAKEFGVRPAQIVKDLKVLWFCGLPAGDGRPDRRRHGRRSRGRA